MCEHTRFCKYTLVCKHQKCIKKPQSVPAASVIKTSQCFSFSPKKIQLMHNLTPPPLLLHEFRLGIINMPGINPGLGRSGQSTLNAPKHSESAVLISIAPLIDCVYRGDKARLPDVHVGLLSAETQACRLPHSKLFCQSAHGRAASPLWEALYLEQEEARCHFKHPLWETGHHA